MNTRRKYSPPDLAVRLLKALLRKDFLEEIQGDMEEVFHYQLETKSVFRAQIGYWIGVIRLLRPNLLRSLFKNQKLSRIGMFTNYSKVSFRNMIRHRTYSAIKIGGLAIGICISLIISLFVTSEWKVDRKFEDKRIYRLLYESTDPARSYKSSTLPPILATTLSEDYPELATVGRMITFDGFFDAGGNLFRPENAAYSVYESRFGYADATIPKMLDFKFLAGNREHALSEPQTMIISKSKAALYFPDSDPVGQLVFLNDRQLEPYEITGVFEDLDETHVNGFHFFITLTGREFWNGEQNDWCCYNYTTYIEIAPQTPPSTFQNKLKGIHDRYFVNYAVEIEDPAMEAIREYKTLSMQPVQDIYLFSRDVSDFLTVSDWETVRLFGFIAGFILLLACMNFINLATANGAQRAKEIGLRKSVGSSRQEIIHQFLLEAIVVTSISVLIGIFLAWLALPFFDGIVGKQLQLPFNNVEFYLLILIFTLLVGTLSGTYPAVYLSKFKAITALRGDVQSPSQKFNILFRKGLVVVQFTISVTLIVGALVVFRQMDFILSKDLGFEKDRVLLIHGCNTMGESFDPFKAEVVNLPGVSSATISSYLPIEGTRRNGNEFWIAGRSKIDEGVSGQMWLADEDYLTTLEMELREGRFFSNSLQSDTAAVVINEAMADALDLSDPLNSKIENYREWNIVGVIRDFHFQEMRQPIKPLVIARTNRGDVLSVRAEGTDLRHTIEMISGIWEKFKPNQGFRFEFLDARFALMYQDVERTKLLIFVFALFGILVACLGLFGLSVFTVEKRSKEITIRKVLGASIGSLFGLLVRDFMRLVMISLIISIPISLYLSSQWLLEFQYRIEGYWDVFVAGSVILMLITLLSVSTQSLKAALSNPATGLRNE